MVSKLTGDLLLAGRLVSLLSTLGICLTLAWIVYRSAPARAPKRAKAAGAILAGALPCGLKTMDWAQLMRVDMLALWLTFAGSALFIVGRTAIARYAAFVLFIAALYTRQNADCRPSGLPGGRHHSEYPEGDQTTRLCGGAWRCRDDVARTRDPRPDLDTSSFTTRTRFLSAGRSLM